MNILEQAKEIIYGDREKTYGHPSRNLQKIADLWRSYLDYPITPEDACNLMILLKAARLQNQPGHTDSLVDICGYAALENGWLRNRSSCNPLSTIL